MSYTIEPHVNGGNAILSTTNGHGSTRIMFNDMLGTTLGMVDNGKLKLNNPTAFGESSAKSAEGFFTGKPYVAGLGHVFLFRNYRPELGKWQTSDPLGYPDGLNNFAYVNNGVTMAFDWLGGYIGFGKNSTITRADVTEVFALAIANHIPVPQPLGNVTWEEIYNTVVGNSNSETFRILPLNNPNDVPGTITRSGAIPAVRIDKHNLQGEIYDQNGNPTGEKTVFSWQAGLLHEIMHVYRNVTGTETGNAAIEEVQIAVPVGNAMNAIARPE